MQARKNASAGADGSESKPRLDHIPLMLVVAKGGDSKTEPSDSKSSDRGGQNSVL
jgi:hypothetical protein